MFKQIVLVGCLSTLVACGAGGGGDGGGFGGTPPPRVKRQLNVELSGLSQPGLVLQTNSGDELVVAENGTHYFGAEVPANDKYAITVKEQPAGEVCTVNNGSGLAVADVSTASVVCSSSAAPYTIGGRVEGLHTGNQVMLKNIEDNDEPLVINVNGQYSFPKHVADGRYYVAIVAQPVGQICTVVNGAGIVNGSNVNNVDVWCAVQ